MLLKVECIDTEVTEWFDAPKFVITKNVGGDYAARVEMPLLGTYDILKSCDAYLVNNEGKTLQVINRAYFWK